LLLCSISGNYLCSSHRICYLQPNAEQEALTSALFGALV